MIKRLISLGIVGLAFAAILGMQVSANAQTFSWPTPISSPSPFAGVTTQPTPLPPLPQLQLCFQDIAGPVTCGQNLVVTAGDYVATGVSVGPPASNGTPSGPFPAKVNLIVNGVTYSQVTVGTNGLIGYATLVGLQIISVSVNEPGYLSSVQTVVTH